MPCNTITTIDIDLNQVDRAMFESAVKNLGYNLETLGEYSIATKAGISLTWQSNSVKLQTRQNTTAIAAEFKKAYSAQVAIQTARRFGWNVKQTSPFAFQLQKR